MWQSEVPRPYSHVVDWNEEEKQFRQRLRRPPACQTPLSQVVKARLRAMLAQIPSRRRLARRLAELQQPLGLADPWFTSAASADGPLDVLSSRVLPGSPDWSTRLTAAPLSTVSELDDTDQEQAGPPAAQQTDVTTEDEGGETDAEPPSTSPDREPPGSSSTSETSSAAGLPCFPDTAGRLARCSTLQELSREDQRSRRVRQDQELQMLVWEVARWLGGETTGDGGQKARRRPPLSVDQLRLLVPALTLNDCQITRVDRGLRRLSRLQLLSLAGNWLTDLPGRRLPAALRSLELFANQLRDVTALSQDPPSWLLHLGLARNQLSDDSHLTLLGDNFKQLRTLDLGDNDICQLEDVLTLLWELKHLRGLRLEGNPCSMCEAYRQGVLLSAPRLHFLDDVEVWTIDREVPSESDIRAHLSQGALVFHCYRVIGLPQPRPLTVAGKKAIQTYYVEVELPLLDPALWQEGVTPPPTPPPTRPESPSPTKGFWLSLGCSLASRSPPMALFRVCLLAVRSICHHIDLRAQISSCLNHLVSGTRQVIIFSWIFLDHCPLYEFAFSDQSSTNGSFIEMQASQATKKSEKGAKSEVVSEDTAVGSVPEEDVVCSSAWFRTQGQPWSRLISFPEPLEVDPPDGDLSTIRDTFRSMVRVKVILLETLPPEKPKKAKGGKKGAATPPPEPPQEILLSRSVLAQFRVPLRPPRWDEGAVDFEWSMTEAGYRPMFAQPAMEPLQDLVYQEKKEKSKAGGSKRGVSSQRQASPPREMPPTLTCHLGVGVRRLRPVPPHLPADEAEAMGVTTAWSIEPSAA